MLQYLPPTVIVRLDGELGPYRSQAWKELDHQRKKETRNQKQDALIVSLYRELLAGAVELAGKHDYILLQTEEEIEHAILWAPPELQLKAYREFQKLIAPTRMYLETSSEELANYLLTGPYTERREFDMEMMDEEATGPDATELARDRYARMCQRDG